MKPNSISGVTYRVADVESTASFYETLGLRVGQVGADYARLYVNWFWVDLVPAGEGSPGAGGGPDLYIKVDDIEEFHRQAVAAGLEPDGDPESPSKGVRQFTLPDPDGHRLVIFEKK